MLNTKSKYFYLINIFIKSFHLKPSPVFSFTRIGFENPFFWKYAKFTSEVRFIKIEDHLKINIL